MRKGFIIILSLLMILIFSLLVMAEENIYQDGQYIGYVADDKGDIVIEVEIKEGNIVDVNMLNPFKLNYQFKPGREAFLKWPSQILEKQSLEVDAVAGATSSYRFY